MRLGSLLSGFAVGQVPDIDIIGLSQDSRTVKPGFVFVALTGTRTNGMRFVQDAIARGAVAIVHDADATMPTVTVPMVAVSSLRDQLGLIADRFFGSPSRELFVIGVTGTNGKTTCTQLLAQVLDRPEARCAIVGTIGNGFPGALAPSAHTTPDPIQLQQLLAELRAAGARTVCMEVSSHALDQRRVAGVQFDIAVLTNLTRDHLDYHGDMAGYAGAKEQLFFQPGLSAAVLNGDDEFGETLAQKLAGRLPVVRYGFDAGDIHATRVQALPTGLAMDIGTPAGEIAIHSRLLGRFNAANLLAVIATLHAMRADLATAASRLSSATAPVGRMECFGGDAHPLVVVDYAHSPDALEQVLKALRAHTRGELWCVFGCGGERDRGKRPLMGAVAERLADRVFVTDDNPRNEAGEQIVHEILAGMQQRPQVIRDREHAIRSAVRTARAGDVVLIAGKGHEDYQDVGGKRLPFSDQAIVQTALREAA